jgi:small-conductance mechanosensitive channel
VVGGLACQNSLSNIAAGIQLIFTRPFEIGDNITVAGVTGTVKRLDFFHTRLVTIGGEGVNIPNSSILGGALTNNSDNYDHSDSSGLRVVNVPLRVPITTDLDKAEKALMKAGKAMDDFIQGLNSDKAKKAFANGTHTLAEYHKLKYKSELAQEQANAPSGVFVGGQVIGSLQETGFDLTLYCSCDNLLFASVKQQAFRLAVKSLKEVGISLC